MRDLAEVTAPVFELKKNPHQAEAYRSTKQWFMKCVLSFALFLPRPLLIMASLSVSVYITVKRRSDSFLTASTSMQG